MPRIVPIAALAACAFCTLALVACGPPAGQSQTPLVATSAPVPLVPEPAPAPEGAMPTRPRLEQLPGGRALAYGWVAHVNLEGGFWAVVAEPPLSGTTTEVVAVLLPGAVDEAGIASYAGSFVAAEGTLQSGTSVRMAGPELWVDAVRVLGGKGR